MKFFFVGLIALAIIVAIALRLYRGRVQVEPKAASKGTARVIARKVSDVDALSITLDINGKLSLAIVLSADGSINRVGTGTLENREHDLFLGRTDPAIFEAVRSHLTEAMLQLLGQTFQKQNPRGAPCKLALTFQFKDSTSDGFVILYGAESEGPPSDVAGFVAAAVRQTDPWYENFKRNAAGRKQP